jgi:hypothetical protein
MTSSEPASIGLADLVANRTMSVEMAATLAAAAAERRSMLFIAIPRLAGKTTTMRAALTFAPEGTRFHELTELAGDTLGIPEETDPGIPHYLIMSEIAQVPFPDYLWGEPVRRVFASLRDGRRALVTALHAGGVEEAFEVIRENGVPDEDAALIDLAVYIRSIGDWHSPTRRAIATMHEIDGVTEGHPSVRLLHRWDEADDRFEAVEPPRRIGTRCRAALTATGRCWSNEARRARAVSSVERPDPDGLPRARHSSRRSP